MEILEQAKNNNQWRFSSKSKKLRSRQIGQQTEAGGHHDDVDLKGLGFDGITLLDKITVSNPYSVPIPISDIAHTVESSERCIASGSDVDPGSRKAHDKILLEVIVKVPHSVAVSVVCDIGGD